MTTSRGSSNLLLRQPGGLNICAGAVCTVQIPSSFFGFFAQGILKLLGMISCFCHSSALSNIHSSLNSQRGEIPLPEWIITRFKWKSCFSKLLWLLLEFQVVYPQRSGAFNIKIQPKTRYCYDSAASSAL